MSTPRLTPGRIAEIQTQLTARDWLILSLLGRLRVATARQIQHLAFLDATPTSNARMSRRTLAKLVDLRLVNRLEGRRGGVRAGSAGDVFTLDVGGRRITGQRVSNRPQIRAPWPISTAFVEHHLGVTDLYVGLVTGSRPDGAQLIDFVTEPAAWRTFTDRGGARAVLKPDAYAVITSGNYQDSWFIEYDRATEGPLALKRQLTAYIDYWHSGQEIARHGVHPKTLWIVPDAKRYDLLIDLLGTLPTEAWPLFEATVCQEAIEHLLRDATDP